MAKVLYGQRVGMYQNTYLPSVIFRYLRLIFVSSRKSYGQYKPGVHPHSVLP